MVETVGEVLGDRTSQMIEIGTLATTPESQGRGYASALVHIATDLVRLIFRFCHLLVELIISGPTGRCKRSAELARIE